MSLHGLEGVLADIVETLWGGVTSIWRWRERYVSRPELDFDPRAERRARWWATLLAVGATAGLVALMGLVFYGVWWAFNWLFTRHERPPP